MVLGCRIQAHMTDLLPVSVRDSHALSLDADRRDAYLERIAIWCEGGPETMEAHRVAWEQVTGERI